MSFSLPNHVFATEEVGEYKVGGQPEIFRKEGNNDDSVGNSIIQ